MNCKLKRNIRLKIQNAAWLTIQIATIQDWTEGMKKPDRQITLLQQNDVEHLPL